MRGAALSGQAAKVLGTESGIPARTLASFESARRSGREALTPTDVLVVDEASMVDVPGMERLLAEARRGGAKVVLVGDPDQLRPIGPGDAFRALVETHGAARLETIYRQKSAWQRGASESLARGDVGGALSAYLARGRVRFAADREEARRTLLLAYFEERTVYPRIRAWFSPIAAETPRSSTR